MTEPLDYADPNTQTGGTEPIDYEKTGRLGPTGESTTGQKLAWVLYDWGNSGYGLILLGPLFTPYFVGTLLPVQPSLPVIDGQPGHGLYLGPMFGVVTGSGVVALMVAVTALFVSVGAPVLGAIADLKGWTRRLFVWHAAVGAVIATFAGLLGPGRWGWGAAVYVASGYCFAISNTFYNAYLPRLTTVERQGRLSGYGFAAGYIGGAAALIVAGYFLSPRWGIALGGVWWLVFSIPAFVMMPRTAPTSDEPVRGSLLLAGFRRVGHTFSRMRKYGMLFLFLLAFLTYNNGIDTIINLSPSFGEDALRMTGPQLVTMFLVVQFVAAGGAFAFGWLADKVGNKVVIASNLVVWCVAAGLVLGVQTAGQFTAVAVLIGLVLGGVQSSSRSLMAKLAPPEIRDEAFGFFSLSGKAVSVFGPLLYFILSSKGGPRAGVFAVLPFLVVGLAIFLFVREPKGDAESS